jgi:hypothetical protein
VKRLALLLMLLAAPAWADPKIAVFTQTLGDPTADQIQATLATLDRGGWPYTLFNANARSWGVSGTADSTWFRQQGYEAVIVLYEDGQLSGTPVVSGPYGANFLDASGTARVSNSPLAGRWGIPCFVFTPKRIVPTASYDDTTANRYVAGIVHTAPGGSFGKPAQSVYGTWGYKLLLRRFQGRLDTLYADPQVFVCRPATWSGAGTTAALAYVTPETTMTCSAGDTAMAAWRFRPRDDRPGTYYFTLRMGFGAGQNVSALMALQYIATLTSIRPVDIIRVPLMEHDAEPGSLTSFGKANLRRLHDTLAVYKMGRVIATPMTPTEYSTLYDAEALTIIRRAFTSGLCRWVPFAYTESGGVQWSFQYFMAPADTAGLRTRFNQVMKTTSNSDSGGFPRSRMDLSRIVTGSGLVGAWGAKVLADAGVRIVESTITAPIGKNWDAVAPVDTAWALQAPINASSSHLFALPGANETRTIYVQNTYGFYHDTSYTRLKAVVGTSTFDTDFLGGTWINSIGIGSTRWTSLYWHTGGGVGVTRQDPYYSWLMSVAGRYFGFFDKVIAPDRYFVNQVSASRAP